MAQKAPELKELGNFLCPILVVPVGDKEYRIPAITAENAAILEASMNGAASELQAGKTADEIVLATDDDTETYFTRVLGPAYQELLDGGAPLVAIKHIMAITLAWTFGDFDKAQEYYKAGGKVRPARKTPADRRPKTVTPTHTGGDATTP